MSGTLTLMRRFGADERGNFAMISAGLMTLLIGCAGLAIDLGTIFADRRKTQTTADLAAIVAAANLSNPVNAASATVTQNNYPASALVKVETGTYTASSAIAPQSRFVTPAVGVANAARVTLTTKTPLYFARYLTGASSFNITTTATATSTEMATFEIGSRLLSVNGGALNALLGPMLGTTLSLSAMDYNSLISAKIDALDFLSALATRVNLTGVSYGDLLSSNVKVGDLMAAALTTQQITNGAGAATTALSTISQAVTGSSTKVSPGTLIDLGPFANLTIGQKPKVGASVSVFDLVNTVAQIANGSHQIATSVNLGLPGIANVSVIATIGERPVGSSWIAMGTQGVSVHTAQTRILATINVLGSGSIASINLPVYVEVASGTATLNAVSCGHPNINTSQVTVGVTPGIVDAWIGNVTVADMTNFATKPNPPPATLVTVLGIPITGLAHAGMGNTTPTNVNFSYSDIQAGTKKTVTTTNFLSSLTASLLGDLTLNIAGIPIPGLGALVMSILNGVTSPIDQVLASLLSTLGIGLGQVDVWVLGIRCDGAVLVN
ncbi:pilus assembly protein TadG-related protein [Bradyrhizobium sp. CER78]|uniref:pilus assembly protein TadG-related protein n=1 Tax=Bradyrhizobium sp. CER78 TaxID=3039162 RepID=UPI00244D5598|nr:pilus assembly protein TadG-related protein [Bradyrhizobium sp. CER78]MDH2383924.1 TadG family pilus assembly protein [Bradyrhizobium sp. CER78]